MLFVCLRFWHLTVASNVLTEVSPHGLASVSGVFTMNKMSHNAVIKQHATIFLCAG